MRLVAFKDDLEGEQLLRMHEFLQTHPCHICLATGFEIEVVTEILGITAIGVSDTKLCSCCEGVGFHFELSMS